MTGLPGSKGVQGPPGLKGATGVTRLQVQAINRRVKRQTGCPGKFSCSRRTVDIIKQ